MFTFFVYLKSLATNIVVSFTNKLKKKTTIEAADAPKDGTINFILTSLSGGSHCSKI